MADLKTPGVRGGGGGAQARAGSCKWSTAAKPVHRATLRLPPTASSGTRGLSAPGVRRAARPARPAASPARAPTRPPTRSAQRSLAWPAPGGEGKLGRVPPSAPRGPQSSRQAAASSTRRQTPGRPIPPRRPGAAPSSTCAGHCPPRAPSLARGGVPSRGARRGGALLLPAAAARGQRGWAAPVKSEGARVWAPRPCRRQRGQGGGGPFPGCRSGVRCPDWRRESSGQQAGGEIAGQDLSWP